MDWIATEGENDRDGRGGCLGGERRRVTSDRAYHGDIAAYQIGRQGGQAAVIAARPTEFDRDVLTGEKGTLLEGTTIGHDQMGRFLGRQPAQETDHRRSARLRAGREWKP